MDEVVGLIKQLCHARDENQMWRIANVLKETEDPRVIPLLIQKLESGSPNDRYNAAQALMCIPDCEAIPALIALLAYEFSEIRGAAIDALVKAINNEPENPKSFIAVTALLEYQKDKDKYVPFHLIKGLGSIKDDRILPALFEMMMEKDNHYQVLAFDDIMGIIKKCEAPEQILRLEQEWEKTVKKMDKNSPEQRNCIVKLAIEISKKRNALASDKGILLTDIPKPPKRGTIYRELDRIRII